MSKLVVFILVAAVYLTPLYPIYAQAPQTTPARPPKPAAAARPASGSALQRLEKAEGKMETTMMNMEAKMATRAAELRAKLQKFRDKNKASRVENIDTKLTELNQKATTRMQANLNSISALLTKVKAWVAGQESAGQDMSAAKTAITTFEGDWTEASASISAQANNDYTITVSTEKTVQTDVKTARDKLKNDLKAVHSQIVNLRQSMATLLSSWKGQSNGQ